MKNVHKQNFTEFTIKEFQHYQKEPLTVLQAKEIQNNLFGIMELLTEWSEQTGIDPKLDSKTL